MLSFKEFLAEGNKSKALEQIENIAHPIYLHMIKLCYFNDPININKHLHDINEWFEDVRAMILKYKIKPNEIYTSLTGIKKSNKYKEYDVEYEINKNLKKYKDLDKLRDIDEVKNILKGVYRKISNDILKSKINILDYLNDYINL